MSIKTANLGFPRIGRKRELKFALESYWAGKSSATALLQSARDLRHRHWRLQQEHGIDVIPSNDFSLYDHVLDHVVMVGAGSVANILLGYEEAFLHLSHAVLASRFCARRATASVSALGPIPKARSTIRAFPRMSPVRLKMAACPLRKARMTSNPLIVARPSSTS
ncbi:hypothetical protein QO005_004669 [Rhizobium paknamense]|uniref:Cobalamin-independent methionine synthase MetE N-terminal domain-containing protein n=1 Tax=Rhizobium paknamense TaxID=1206817 RepID=A0ABU0IJ78_9HYPH|nr:hypothetical protein [Rhizobium paknamense]